MRMQAEHAITEAAESCRALHDEWQATVPFFKSLSELTRRAKRHCKSVSSRIACSRQANIKGGVASTTSSCMPFQSSASAGLASLLGNGQHRRWHLGPCICHSMRQVSSCISEGSMYPNPHAVLAAIGDAHCQSWGAMSSVLPCAGALTPFGDLHNYRAPSPPFIPELPGVLCGKPLLLLAGLPRSAAPRHHHCWAGVSGLSIGSGGPSGDGVYDEESAEYRLYTRVALSPGDQVYLQYGCYTNLELLGGFCMRTRQR